MEKILVINPGSTSTKIAVYEDDKPIFVKTLQHSSQELSEYKCVAEQFAFRRSVIIGALNQENVDLSSITVIIGRGGLLKPMPSGIYELNEALLNDLQNATYGEHASNLGGLLACNIASEIGARAFIADPVVVDEMSEVAHITGHPLFTRHSIFHALNQKAVARKYAYSQSKEYEDINLIVAHLGGGISVGAHLRGKIVDVNNALDGDGAFSPERSGTLPAGQLAEACFSGEYTHKDIKKMLTGGGGIVAHLGTNDVRDVIAKINEGDSRSKLIIEAMCYNVGKEIGAIAAVLKGEVDAIIITGGIAYSDLICSHIREMVEFIAPVAIYPGEDEMEALAYNGLMVAQGKLTPKIYV